MKKLLLILLLASCLLRPASAQVNVNCSMLDGSNNSNIYNSKYFIIKSAAQWKSLPENKVVSNPRTLQTIAAFDFSKQWLLLWFAGDQCNGTQLSGASLQGDVITLQIFNLQYDVNCHGAKLLVSPWMLIAFDAQPDNKVVIHDDPKDVNCD